MDENESPAKTGTEDCRSSTGISASDDRPAYEDRNSSEDRLWRKAYWLVHSYLDQQAVCEQCKVELASMPPVTWQDAYYNLAGHGDPFSERVQSSNISDQTYRIAVNIDDEIARMTAEIRREPEQRLKKAQANVDVMDTVFVMLRILESEKEYRDTYTFADQFCRKGLRLTEVKDHNGRRMSRYAANREKKKVVQQIVEELKRRDAARKQHRERSISDG